jgi:hypothetical protein
VKPETVMAWHRKGFRLYWTWKSGQGQPGRPLLTKESRELIRKMSLAKAPSQFYVTDRILSNHSQKRTRLCIPAD